MNIKVFVEDGAKMPTKAHEYDAGYDLYCNGLVQDFNHANIYHKCFHTGVHVEIPHGYVGLVMTKSGLHKKYGMTCTGVIDSGYTGEIIVTMNFVYNDDWQKIENGEKIAQLVIVPLLNVELEQVETIEELPTGERGSNGFGSTGRF